MDFTLWMLYGSGVALLLGAAAHAGERICVAAHRPTRWPWTAALVGSVFLPPLLSRHTASTSVATGLPIHAFGPTQTLFPGGMSTSGAGTADLLLERILAFGWLGASLLLGVFLLVSARTIHRERRSWRHRRMAGRGVWVSRATGPALVGLLWTEVVVPDWVLGRDPETQRMLVAHEEEHEAAGDPFLLLLGIVAVVLFPWNAALWWQSRRLRGAVELDCDARVMRRLPAVAAYGRLLIEVGRLRGRTPLPMAAFSSSRTLLERRIRQLTGTTTRPPPVSHAALWLAVVLAPLAACALPVSPLPAPERLWPAERSRTEGSSPGAAPQALPGSSTAAVGLRPTFTPYDDRPELRNGGELAEALSRYAGEAAAGASVVFWAFLDEAGAVRSSRIASSSGDASFDRAASRALREIARFTPARNRGARVPAWIQVPVAVAGSATEFRTDRTFSIPIATTPAPQLPAHPPAGVVGPGAAPLLLDAHALPARLARSYPASGGAFAAHTAAEVWVYVDAAGRVRQTQLASSSGDRALDLVAGELLRRARFAPARQEGRPVGAWTRVPIAPPASALR